MRVTIEYFFVYRKHITLHLNGMRAMFLRPSQRPSLIGHFAVYLKWTSKRRRSKTIFFFFTYTPFVIPLAQMLRVLFFFFFFCGFVPKVDACFRCIFLCSCFYFCFFFIFSFLLFASLKMRALSFMGNIIIEDYIMAI